MSSTSIEKDQKLQMTPAVFLKKLSPVQIFWRENLVLIQTLQLENDISKENNFSINDLRRMKNRTFEPIAISSASFSTDKKLKMTPAVALQKLPPKFWKKEVVRKIRLESNVLKEKNISDVFCATSRLEKNNYRAPGSLGINDNWKTKRIPVIKLKRLKKSPWYKSFIIKRADQDSQMYVNDENANPIAFGQKTRNETPEKSLEELGDIDIFNFIKQAPKIKQYDAKKTENLVKSVTEWISAIEKENEIRPERKPAPQRNGSKHRKKLTKVQRDLNFKKFNFEFRNVLPNSCKIKWCGKECDEISEERRFQFNRFFWALSSENQRHLLLGQIVKFRKNGEDGFVCDYCLTVNGVVRKVCLQFLLDALNVKEDLIVNFVLKYGKRLCKNEF